MARHDSRLVRGLKPDDVAEFTNRFKATQDIREAIAGVLTRELEGAILQSESEGILESPNALATLADQMGFRRGLRLAIKLLTNQEDQ